MGLFQLSQGSFSVALKSTDTLQLTVFMLGAHAMCPAACYLVCEGFLPKAQVHFFDMEYSLQRIFAISAFDEPPMPVVV